MTKDDTEGYEIITFDGGLFAAAIADSWEYSEYERISRGVESWLARQEYLTLDESLELRQNPLFYSAQGKRGNVNYILPAAI